MILSRTDIALLAMAALSNKKWANDLKMIGEVTTCILL